MARPPLSTHCGRSGACYALDVDEETQGEEGDRANRRAGCLVALSLWVLIGIPFFMLNLMGECLPRDDPNIAACDAERQWLGWFSIFGSPILFGLIGWG